MAEILEQIIGNDLNESITQIYIGTINKRYFIQMVYDNHISELQYLDSKLIKNGLNTSNENEKALIEHIGQGFALLIYKNIFKDYEIKNGFCIDKKTGQNIQVEKLSPEIELDLRGEIRISLMKLYGKNN